MLSINCKMRLSSQRIISCSITASDTAQETETVLNDLSEFHIKWSYEFLNKFIDRNTVPYVLHPRNDVVIRMNVRYSIGYWN